MKQKIMKSSQFMKTARRITGLTQEAFASKIGLSQANYSRYETGHVDMTLSKFIDACEKTGVDPAEVINRVLGIKFKNK